MTSLKQIESNRRNAQKSTGPRTEEGKQRASRNAVRHGLTAETVIEPLEDADDYQAFEQAVASGYDAQTAVERELVLRLASLLWRLRRATSIEVGLFQIQGELLLECSPIHQSRAASKDAAVAAIFKLPSVDHNVGVNTTPTAASPAPEIARSFLRLADLGNGAFERLGRYEMALWRQVRQTLFTLEVMGRRSLRVRYPRQHRYAQSLAMTFDGVGFDPDRRFDEG